MNVTRYLTYGKGVCLLFIHLLVGNIYSQITSPPTPVLCFEFSTNLDATGGNVSLTSVGSLGSYSMDVQSSCENYLYEWEIGNGLKLQNPGNYFPQDHYTIELLFKFTSQPYLSSWQKILDFKDQTSDHGIYTFLNNMQMYPQSTGSSGMAQANTWLHVFITRESATDRMKCYLENNLEIEFIDAIESGVFTNALGLFIDDNVVSSEVSAGIIDYMKIYDYPLAESEINSLVDTPQVQITGNQPVCSGDPLVLYANGADSYVWSTGETTSSITVYPSMLNTIILNGTINTGCSQMCLKPDTVQLSETDPILINLGSDTSMCSGETLVLNASTLGGSYLWQDGSTSSSFTVVQAGTYWVEVTVGGCSEVDTVEVNYSPLVTFDLGNNVSLCQGEKKVLNASMPGATYLWQDGSTSSTFTVVQAGTYWVEVAIGNCSKRDTIEISYIPFPSFDLGNDTLLCHDATLELNTAINGGTFLWQDGSSQSSYTVIQEGIYWVDVSIGNCSQQDTIEVNYVPIDSIYFGNDTTLCSGTTLVLDAHISGGTYLWQDGSTLSSYTVVQEGVYWVEVMVGGCLLNSNHLVVQKGTCCDVYVPNSFTPDEDQINDYFFPVFNCSEEAFAEYNLSIYNRWGELIFQTDQFNDSWNGMYEGKMSPSEVYVYKLVYQLRTSEEILNKVGKLNLMR